MSIKFDFSLVAEDSKARAGLLRTAHGDIETPIFMPVGTLGTVKAMHLKDVLALGSQIILGNTFRFWNTNTFNIGNIIWKMGWDINLNIFNFNRSFIALYDCKFFF